MGGWTNPTSIASSAGIDSNAPLSSLLPKPMAQNPDVPGTSSSSNLQFESNALATGGKNAIASGTSLLGKPLDYWQKLLQPPTKASLTEQQGPAISSIVGQYSTGKKALANAPRGGGTTATAAELPFQEAGAITGLLEQQLAQTLNVLQPEAAAAISGIANTLSSLGLSELGITAQDLTSLMAADITKRGQNMQALNSLGQGIGSMISSLIAPGGALNKGATSASGSGIGAGGP